MRRLGTLLLVGAIAVAGFLPAAGAEARSGPPAPIGDPPPRPVADYRFQNTLTSSVAGAPRLRNLNLGPGLNVFAQEMVDGRSRTVLQFPRQNGLALPNATNIIARGRYTMAIRMRFAEVDDYRRIINFKPVAADNDTGLYLSTSDLAFYDYPEPDHDPVAADQWVLVVLTRAANGTLRGFLDGVRQFAVIDSQGLGKIGADNRLRFFRDNDNREEASGAVARIRIWDVPLTPDQVQHLSAV